MMRTPDGGNCPGRIQASSVTPFSDRALDRDRAKQRSRRSRLPGVLAQESDRFSRLALVLQRRHLPAVDRVGHQDVGRRHRGGRGERPALVTGRERQALVAAGQVETLEIGRQADTDEERTGRTGDDSGGSLQAGRRRRHRRRRGLRRRFRRRRCRRRLRHGLGTDAGEKETEGEKEPETSRQSHGS